MVDPVQASKKSMEAVVRYMERRGYIFALVVGVKPAQDENERVRLGMTPDLKTNQALIGPMIRLLRDTADILERGGVGELVEPEN